MNTGFYQKQFQETCYIPAVKGLLKRTGEVICSDSDKILPFIIEPIAAFMFKALQLQELGAISSVDQITVSFLRTSLICDRPAFQLDAYGEVPFLDAPELSGAMDAAWLFTEWEHFQQDIRKRITKEVLGKYIREPQIRSYESKAVTLILNFILFYLKYIIRNLEEKPVWKEFTKRKAFTLSFGEYVDWQVPVMVIKPEVDIFFCDKDTDLTFCRFQERYYDEKKMDQVFLDDCVFERCTFKNMVFDGTYLRNVRFLECEFLDCQFNQVQIMGMSALSSRFKKVTFKKCRLEEGWYAEDGIKQYYAPGQFKWCLLEDVTWLATPLAENTLTGCQLFDCKEA